MSYADVHDRHVRLGILRLLDQAPGYAANDSILAQSIEQLGLACTRDQMRGHLHWLEEQRAVTLVHPASSLIVATLTERGAEYAKGRATTAGIQRPTPGAGI